MKIYIAAPFFNLPELQVVQRIEATIQAKGHQMFSPRLQDESMKDETGRVALNRPAIRKAIFEENYRSLVQCDLVLAWIDRKQKHENITIRMCVEKPILDSTTKQLTPVGGPLVQPDLGTVWEMGAAYCHAKPIVAFTMQPEDVRLNVMLLESCWGMVRGWDALANMLAARIENMHRHFTPYEGAFSEHA